MASRQRRVTGPGAAVLAVVGLALGGTLAAHAQDRPETNPLAGDAAAIRQGQNIYRGRCAVCHGIDAKGYRGSDLTTGDWVHGGSDAQICQDHPLRRAGHRDAGQSEPVRGRGLDAGRLPADAERAGRTGGGARRRDAGRAAVLGRRRGELRPLPHGGRHAAAGSGRSCRASAPRARRRRSSARFGGPAR